MKELSKARRITILALLLATGLILPFATAHGFGIPGNILLPMHLPVFVGGLLLGPLEGAVLGLTLPFLSSILTSMPAFYPQMPMMTAELFVYGLISGLLYKKTPMNKTKWGVYVSLVSSMVAGRLAYALVFNILLYIESELKAATAIASLITGIPGIIIQLIIVPLAIFALQKAEKKRIKKR